MSFIKMKISASWCADFEHNHLPCCRERADSNCVVIAPRLVVVTHDILHHVI